MTHPRYAILGGGLAGLTLAVQMARAGLAQKGLVIVEPRSAYRRDRTWCYWNVESHAFEDARAHEWTRWRVRHGSAIQTHGSERYSYCEVPADLFYEAAIARLRGTPGVEIVQPARVEAVRPDGDEYVVELDRGSLRARNLFDSRPQARPGALLQHFVGQEIHASRDAFDPTTVELMDFAVPQDDGIHFVYVLPYSRRHALVEATWIGERLHADAVYEDAIRNYVRQRFGLLSYRTEYEERGAIPMDARAPEIVVAPGWYRIGGAGGLVRPSTGYAFLAVQRWTREFVAALARTERPEPPPAYSPMMRTLDAIFLEHLRDRPEAGPALFYRLFAETQPDTLVSFLAGTASPAQVWRVIRALPALPMLHQAVTMAARSMRR